MKYLGNEHWKLEAGELEARSWNAGSRKLEGKIKLK